MSSFRHIPAIDELLLQARIMRLLEIYRRDYIVTILQDTVAESRKRLRHTDQEVTKEEIITVILDHVESKASKQARGTLQRVMNGTGVVLHTNLVTLIKPE